MLITKRRGRRGSERAGSAESRARKKEREAEALRLRRQQKQQQAQEEQRSAFVAAFRGFSAGAGGLPRAGAGSRSPFRYGLPRGCFPSRPKEKKS